MPRFLSLAEAVEATVRDGDSVAMEGFTHLIPHAAGHEVIRQGRKRLTLIRMTPDLIYDQLIGMGCAEKVVFSWGGNPGVGSLHRFRDAVENGWPSPLAIEEHSHAAMANAYEAGAAGLPCAVFRGYIGVDLPKVNPNIKSMTCPFSGETLAVVPSLRPDVGIVHAQTRRPRRQRDVRRHRRRAEGSGAGLEAHAGHRRRGGRGFRRAQLQHGDPAVVDNRRHRGGAGRRVSLLRAGLLQTRQFLLQILGRNLARARQLSARGSKRTCWSRVPTCSPRMCARSKSRPSDEHGAKLHAQRNDDRHRGARTAQRRHLLRRHRRAVGGVEPGAAHARARHHADLRIRHARHQAGRAAALDRRQRIVRDRADDGVGAGDVPLLAAGRAHFGRLHRRRADRQVRQPQHHGGRRLRQAEGAAAGRRRRAGDFVLVRGNLHHHGAEQTQLCAEARFHHLVRPRHRRRQSRAARPQDQGADEIDDGPLRAGARSRDQGNDRGQHPSGRHARADRGGDRLAGALRQRRLRRRRRRPHTELETLRELHARTARAHGAAN